MDTPQENPSVKIEVERLAASSYLKEVTRGIGVSLGLGLLWVLEIVRNTYFGMLDRMNVKPKRSKRASAFPPGQPRKHTAIRA